MMKTKLLLSALAIIALAFTSCKKDEDSKIDKSETISLGASYVNDVYYSLSNGVIDEVPRANWDIAFSVSTRSSSIIINESTDIILKAYPNTWTWATDISDTTGFHTWTSLRNADTDWEIGAFNANATGHPNYGWGIYNTVNHNIENAEGGSLYIMKFADGTMKKIWIETKYSAIQKYSFRYADLNGDNEQTISNMDISNSKANYVYYSLQDNLRLDREPDATTWDLLFTKWEDLDGTTPYVVTGVLQNIGVTAIDFTTEDPFTITYSDEQFSTNINTIGWDWKSINMSTYVWTIPTDRFFIVRAKDDKIYRINFTDFTGSSTGNISFKVTEL